MNEDYIDRLVGDIQEYLREEDEKSRLALGGSQASDAEPTTRKLLRRPSLAGSITFLSACAVGSITVAILLLGVVGVPSENSISTIWLFAAGGCGIFFSAMLISVWRRLLLLGEIEKNTRLILESKQTANALLEQYIKRVT